MGATGRASGIMAPSDAEPELSIGTARPLAIGILDEYRPSSILAVNTELYKYFRGVDVTLQHKGSRKQSPQLSYPTG